jgi:hypothetical protein
MADVEDEVKEIQDKTRELKAQLPELQRAKDEAYDKYAGPGVDLDAKSEESEEAGRLYELAFKRQLAVTDAIKRNEKEVEKLRSPEEFDRRMEQSINAQGGIKRMTETAAKPKKQTAKDRGVPDVYLNAETGNFKVGADARYKSDLVSSALGLDDSSRLMDFDAKDAEARLTERGWMSFLDRKREIIAEKERKSAERAKEREEAARVKAEEKAAAKAKADQEKASAAESKAAKAEGQAVPDPKPGKGKAKAKA